MATLNVQLDEAAHRFQQRLQEGLALLEQTKLIGSEEQFDNWRHARRRWANLSKETLKYVYEDAEGPVDEFEAASRHVIYSLGGTWQEDLRDAHRDCQREVNVLVSLIERLQFATAAIPQAESAKPAALDPRTAVIFLVHGRNKGVREEVARFLERAGTHQVVILDEQASRSRTLIEQFEKHADNAKYAVVLLTGDDVGGPNDEAERRPRARQNVVFELGFFFGRLGREHVTVLYEADVEKPSDMDGLAYVSLSSNWRERLVRELRDARLDFSLDRV